MACCDPIKRVRKMIWESTQFSSATTCAHVQNEIERVRADCGSAAGDFLDVELRLVHSNLKVPLAIERLRRLLEADNTSDYLRVCIHITLARLTFDPRDPCRKDEPHRRAAIAVADQQHFDVEALAAAAHWCYALLAREELSAARVRANDVHLRLDRLPDAAISDPYVSEVRARLYAIEGQLLLRESLAARVPFADVLPAIQHAYKESISADPQNAHRRMNTPTELADLLASQGPEYWPAAKSVIDGALHEALQGYAAHPCDRCRAYFHQTFATRHRVAGVAVYGHEPEAAVQMWRKGIEHCDQSIGLYERIDHPFVVEPTNIKQQLQELIAMAEKPRRVFLSHKCADKPMVRDFQRTLQVLRYEPWLDEDAMAAGVPLERALLQGIKESCAVVFFITPAFTDKSFLRTEIDYAIAQKRERPEFAIITLVFKDLSGRPCSVPELLKTYVYKVPETPLAALQEIIRALPIQPQVPRWS